MSSYYLRSSARATFDRLRVEPPGEGGAFKGSYSAVKRAYHRLKRERSAGKQEVVVPLATQAGQEAQVDFGYAGRFYDPAPGVMRRAWVFVMLLCHSRLMFVRLVFDQKIEPGSTSTCRPSGPLASRPSSYAAVPRIKLAAVP